MRTWGFISSRLAILAQRASTDSSDSFLLAVQDERIEDKAAEQDSTVDKLGISNDTSVHDVLSAQESVAMDHDSRSVCWEVASRNLNYWNAVEVADKAAAEELIVVAGSFNIRGNLLLDSVVEGWSNPEYAASDRSLSFVESSAHLEDIAVAIVSGWWIVLGSSRRADSSIRKAGAGADR